VSIQGRDPSIAVIRRHDIRLPEYDYSTPGTYFVTICVQNRACIFGDITDSHMALNAVGRLIESWWAETDRRFTGIESDAYVIMPNHFHALVRLGWTDGSTFEERFGETHEAVFLSADGLPREGRHGGLQLQDDGAVSLSNVVQWFKSATTSAYSRRVASDGWARFPGRLWQQNYFEHIIRDEAKLDRARLYIEGNPGKWSEDAEFRLHCRGF
jgi:REP element-mobilizing transposase RayT